MERTHARALPRQLLPLCRHVLPLLRDERSLQESQFAASNAFMAPREHTANASTSYSVLSDLLRVL